MDTKNITEAKKLIKTLEGIVDAQTLFRKIADNEMPDLQHQILYVGTLSSTNVAEKRVIDIPYHMLRQISSCVALLLDEYKNEIIGQIEKL